MPLRIIKIYYNGKIYENGFGKPLNCSISCNAKTLQGLLPINFSQSNSSTRIQASVHTLLKATYAWPSANIFLPKYMTALSTVEPFNLWTVEAQDKTIGNILLSAVP